MPVELADDRVVGERMGAVVLGQQPVDVRAAAADGQRPAGGGDQERVGRLARDDAAPEDVHDLGAQAAVEQLDELVEVGIERDPALLHEHARVVGLRCERPARVVAGHRPS